MESDLQCRFIFVMREEYMAGITEFEKYIPTIFANRVRIEKISHHNALDAIMGPCKVANINLEEGFAETLLEKLSPEGSDIELTYLQVFLDKIFHYAQPENNTNPVRVSFTLNHLQKVGNVSDLLGSFLDEQIGLLDDPETGLIVLKSFVSIKSTKKQMSLEEVHEYFHAFGKQIDISNLQKIIQTFINLRILRDKDQNGKYELRHDALAAKVYENISLIEKEILEVRQFIENGWNNFQKRGVLFSPADINYIAPYESRLYLSKDLANLIDKSKAFLIRTKRRRRHLALISIIGLLISFGGFTIWALSERKIAFNQLLRSNMLVLTLKAREAYFRNPTKAIDYAQIAYNKDSRDAMANQTLVDIFHSTESRPFYLISIHKRIISARFSTDCKSILTASWDGTVKLWDLSGKCLNTFTGLKNDVSYANFSPDGKFILTSSYDQTAKIWDLSGKCLITLSGHSDRVMSASYSSDNKLIITASFDRTAKLWDLSGKCLITFSGHSGGLTSAVFSPDCKYILTASSDATAKVWDLSGKCLNTFIGHTNGVNSALFSPDSKLILTASSDKTVKLWDKSGRCLLTFLGHDNRVNSAVFSPDGKSVLSASNDKKVILWDLSGRIFATLLGHSDIVYTAFFSPDGKYIFTDSGDQTAKLWDISDQHPIHFAGHSGFVMSAVFSHDGKFILSSSIDRNIKLWDITGKCLATFSAVRVYLKSEVFSPDSKLFLINSSDTTTKICDLSGKVLVTLSGHTDLIKFAVFSPDGKSVLTASDDKTAKLWDLSGQCLVTFRGHTDGVSIAQFSPDGAAILTVSPNEGAKLWDLSGICLATLSGHKSTIRSACFSPDGKSILTASDDWSAKLWDQKGKCLTTYSGHSDNVMSACYSPDGKSIITASYDKSAKLWDLSGRCHITFSGHSEALISAVFSPDGKLILTTSNDQIEKLWNLSGRCLVTLTGHFISEYQTLNYSTFSPDGKFILTTGEDVAKLWFTPSSVNNWLTTRKIGSLSPKDKSEINELDDFKSISQSNNVETITDYADWYLSNTDTIKAILLYKRAMELDPNSVDRRILASIYRKQNRIDYYVALYKDDSVSFYKDEIAFLNSNEPVDYKESLLHYTKVAELYEKLLLEELTQENEIEAANNYNAVGWFGLLSGNYKEALAGILRGLELCPSNEYLNSNLPLCYLLTDKYVKAKIIYLEWKDRPWTVDNSFKTFKEAFINDIAELESRGIAHPDFVKVKELLNN